RDVVGIRREREAPPSRPAKIVDQHVVILDAPAGIEPDPIEHLDDRADLDLEPGLFEHLAGDGRPQRLAHFDRTPGKAPFAFQRFVRATHQQYAIVADDDRPDADNRPLGIYSQTENLKLKT